MRLINTKTGRFEEFVDLKSTPLYAILSHTWDRPPKREQSYQEVVKIQEKFGLSSAPDGEVLPDALLNTACHSIWDTNSGLSEKVQKACEIARHDGYEYIWVDLSCIDKTSSSELSEAINSMFNWYCGAQVCYAFLVDVPSDDDLRAVEQPLHRCKDGEEPAMGSNFRKSQWFKHAWTLQELIAPRLVVFLLQDWEPLGMKDLLADLVEEITRIDRAILTHEKALADESVVDRMRWAARRKATRVGDEAYSLLGIFRITMPTLYGEGEYAFRRLQEEILQRIPDRSLFAWGNERMLPPTGREISSVGREDSSQQSLFAPSPRFFNFKGSRTIPASRDALKSLNLPVEEYTPTPYGIRTSGKKGLPT